MGQSTPYCSYDDLGPLTQRSEHPEVNTTGERVELQASIAAKAEYRSSNLALASEDLGDTMYLALRWSP